ncbi:MAG: peptidylprolyl isomerase [Acidobacteriota bacterium]
MKRTLLALTLALAAMPLSAQTDGDKLVARVNGEEFTNRRVDELWNQLSTDLQQRYIKSGKGKLGFLKNYLDKYLLIQDAERSGFAEKVGAPRDLDPKGEAVLFDRYVKDVVAAPLFTEEEMKKVYQDRNAEFQAPEQGWIGTIRAQKKDKPEVARETMSKVMVELFSARTVLAQTYSAEHLHDALAAKFAEIARRVSDDPSAEAGGDLGFVAMHTLDPKIADAVRMMKSGAISGILETNDAFQMIIMHEHRQAGIEPYETAQNSIRSFLMSQNQKRVLDAVTKRSAELRANGKVEIFENNLR